MMAHHCDMAAPHTMMLACKVSDMALTIEKLRVEVEALRGGLSAFTVRCGTGNSRWCEYTSTVPSHLYGLYMDVDTSMMGWKSNNIAYTASITGTGCHWILTGMTSIYPYGGVPTSPSSQGFRIYVRYANQSEVIGASRAHSSSWNVSWIGVEGPGSL